jgi:hypothetical protein
MMNRIHAETHIVAMKPTRIVRLPYPVRGFRSYLSLPPPPKPLPLGFHRRHLSLRGVQIHEQMSGLLLAGSAFA